MKVRSVVGLLPLCAIAIVEKEHRDKLPDLTQHMLERIKSMPEVAASIHPTGPDHLGVAERGILALMGPERLRRVLGTCSMRTNSWARTESDRCRDITGITRTSSICRARNIASTICLPNRIRECSAATRIGGAPSGCRSTPYHSRTDEILPLLRRQLPSGMPDWVGKDDEPL